MAHRIMILAGAILAGAAPGSSETRACMPLEQAMRLSVLNSPAVETAEAARARARADLTDARAVRRPQLSAFARTQAGDQGLTGAGIENTVGLRASQRIYDFGQSRLERQAAESLLKARGFEVASEETRTALQTAEAYISLAEIEAQLEITAERESFFRRQLEATQSALDVGGATRADVAEIAARLAEASADRLELRFERDRFSTELASDVGSPIRPCALQGPGAAAIANTSTLDRVNRALDRNSELRSLSAAIEGQSARVARAERNRLPALELVGIASYAYEDRIGDWEYRDRIGIDVSIPLLSGGALDAERQRAEAELASQRSRRNTLRRDLIESVEVSSQRLLSLRARTARRSEVAERQREQFEAARVEFEAGLRTLPDLVDDRLELEAARLEAVRVRFAFLREHVNLRALTGELVNGKS